MLEDPPASYATISVRLGIPVGSIGPTRARCLDKMRRHPAIAALINAEAQAQAAGAAAGLAGLDHLARRRRPGHQHGRPTARRNRELARRADELAASRHRLATAADAERRRIERDLHDGAQQHLVAAAVTLRLARRTAQTDPSGSAVLLGDLAGQLHDAIGEIRRLARGIYPPVLAANGLPAALPAAAAKAGLPTTVHLDGIGRYPPQIEAAVYFCCLEALNNAAKHAGAHARATITARQDAATLTVTITDTGHGYNPAATSHGTGLTNIADRLAVHAGTLHIRTQPNHGTTLTLQIPATKPATPQ